MVGQFSLPIYKDVINECLTLFEGQVVEVRYTEERKKRLEQYLKWSKEKKQQQETIGASR